MGRTNKSGGVRILKGRFQLDFEFQTQRCRPTLTWPVTSANEKAARKLVADIKRRINLGEFDLAKEFPEYKGLDRFGAERAKPQTFAHYAKVWETASTRKAAATVKSYNRILTATWLPAIGSKRVDRVKPSELREAMGKDWANKTFNNVLAVARVVFDLAVADKVIDDNPARKIDFERVQTTEPDPLDPDEIDAVLEVLGKKAPDIRAYFEVAIFAGLRPSEIIALRWSDVDLKRGIIMVQRARVMGAQKATTKTYKARRVEAHARAIAAIESMRPASQLKNEHVFLNPVTGRIYIDEQNPRRYWNAALKAAKVRHREAYQCRHTCATMLLMAGCNDTWAAGQLGHSPEVFRRTYARWLTGVDNRRQIEKFEAEFGSDLSASPTKTKRGR